MNVFAGAMSEGPGCSIRVGVWCWVWHWHEILDNSLTSSFCWHFSGPETRTACHRAGRCSCKFYLKQQWATFPFQKSWPPHDKFLSASQVAMCSPSPCHVNYSVSYSNTLPRTAHIIRSPGLVFELEPYQYARLVFILLPGVCVIARGFHIGSTFNYSALTKYCLIMRYLVSLKPQSWHRKAISAGMHECAKLSKKCWWEQKTASCALWEAPKHHPVCKPPLFERLYWIYKAWRIYTQNMLASFAS